MNTLLQTEWLDTVYVGETLFIKADFTGFLGSDTPTGTPTVSAEVYADEPGTGTDSDPSAICVSNGVGIVGNVVQQKISGMQRDVNYLIKFGIDTVGGQHLVLPVIVPCRYS